jgi:hypothetical protein
VSAFGAKADIDQPMFIASIYESTAKWRAVNLAVPSLCAVPDVGTWSAPCVVPALAGVVHHREGASGSKHNYGQDDRQWVLHGDLANAGPRLPLPNYRVSNEPNVNAPGTVAALRFASSTPGAMESGGLH